MIGTIDSATDAVLPVASQATASVAFSAESAAPVTLETVEAQMFHHAAVAHTSIAEIVRLALEVRDKRLWATRTVLDEHGHAVPVYSGWLEWLDDVADRMRSAGLIGFSAASIRLRVRAVDYFSSLGYSVEEIANAPYLSALMSAVRMEGGKLTLRKSGPAAITVEQLVDGIVGGSDHSPRELLHLATSPGPQVTFYDYHGELWAVVADDVGWWKERVASLNGPIGDALRQRLRPRAAEDSAFFADG